MRRLTYGDVKGRIGKLLKLCEDSDRLLEYVNLAQESILYSGKFVDMYGRYTVCGTQSCITLPRQLMTIEAAAVCKTPVPVRSEFFEFLESGPGILDDDDDVGYPVVDKGVACAFDDVVGDNKRLAVYADLPETTGAVVNVQFYQDNGIPVRTSYAGSWIDGENITIGTAGTYSYSAYNCAPGGLMRVNKPVTNGTIRLYEHDTVNNTYRPLSFYEHDETKPMYRRYMIPHLTNLAAGSTDCSAVRVTIVGKLAHIPAVDDASYLQVNHERALGLMCQSIHKADNNLMPDSLLYESQAKRLMNEQLDHYKGHGEQQPLRWIGDGLTGPAVENLI